MFMVAESKSIAVLFNILEIYYSEREKERERESRKVLVNDGCITTAARYRLLITCILWLFARILLICILSFSTCAGTSDPYIKFKCGNKVLHKSKTILKCLDPVWDEHFVLAVDDIFTPLTLKVYDHDFGFQDDYLGMAIIQLTQLQFNVWVPLSLLLSLSLNSPLNTNQSHLDALFLIDPQSLPWTLRRLVMRIVIHQIHGARYCSPLPLPPRPRKRKSM